MTARNPLLELECARLCRLILGGEPPPGCVEAYLRAHAVVFPSPPTDKAAAVAAEALRRGWDLEALEFALRLGGKENALSKKVNILFYVLEASPGHFDEFVNMREATLRGWMALTGAVLRSAWLLAKGRFLLWRLRGAAGTAHA